MEHINYRHTPPRVAFSLLQDVTSSIEQWIYISMGGYTFEADVRDLSIHNRQSIHANLFI